MSHLSAVHEFERNLLLANEPLRRAQADAVASGSARISALSGSQSVPAWPGATPKAAQRSATIQAEAFAVLAEYALATRELVTPEDNDRWRELVAEAERRRGAGVLADELRLSGPGAALLRVGIGAEPPTGRRRAPDCACGYQFTGVLPERLCPETADILLRRWVAEERRLLRRFPELAADITAVLERTAERQSREVKQGGEYLASDMAGRLRSGGRKLARLRRRHARELSSLDLSRWRSLAELLSRDARPAVQPHAARAAKRGLGSAGLAEIAVRGLREVERMSGEQLARRRREGR
ncbi:hypothetical protein [Leucobacter sp. M11]|uniref:hypothetical protein n=1 Tax=Leucobacter sp. M11 TaxID=2993565 RepID=UPI002D7F229A|nr:hypothetical protein [Leucobacter sp. M11]MEB4615143.1 hypothetical protein [Leucobacter sp. M11]